MTNTDKTVSTERLALAEEIIQRWAQWIVHVSADMEEPEWTTASANSVANDRDFVLSVLSASRTQSPAEVDAWDIEATADKIAKGLARIEGGRLHAVTYSAALAGALEGLKTAREHIRAASITPPAPERSKEEVGVEEKIEAFVTYGPLRSYDHEKLMDRVLGPALESLEEVRDTRGNLTGWNIVIAALSKPGEQG